VFLEGWGYVKRQLKRVLILSVGSFFILLGIAGLFLPFLQGILFLIIGLVILSKESKTAHRILEGWKERHPELHSKFDEIKKKLKRRLGMAVHE
jgi:uncharacterized membrane protein YbaN (DUF454 family)